MRWAKCSVCALQRKRLPDHRREFIIKTNQSKDSQRTTDPTKRIHKKGRETHTQMPYVFNGSRSELLLSLVIRLVSIDMAALVFQSFYGQFKLTTLSVSVPAMAIFRCGALLSCSPRTEYDLLFVNDSCGFDGRHRRSCTAKQSFGILRFIRLELEYVIFAWDRDFHTEMMADAGYFCNTHTQTLALASIWVSVTRIHRSVCGNLAFCIRVCINRSRNSNIHFGINPMCMWMWMWEQVFAFECCGGGLMVN